jgi:hypothetical protein
MNKFYKYISTSTLRNKNLFIKQLWFSCNSNYSLKHVLIECVDVSDVSQTFYNVNNSTDLFTNVDTILSFKKIDLYAKL